VGPVEREREREREKEREYFVPLSFYDSQLVWLPLEMPFNGSRLVRFRVRFEGFYWARSIVCFASTMLKTL